MHGDLPGVGQDDAPELREIKGLGFEKNRLRVQDVVPKRNDQEDAPKHLGPYLAPQGELLGNHGIVVDARLDLVRAVHVAACWKAEQDQFAVSLPVVACRHPTHQVVTVVRCERLNQQELLLFLTGQTGHDVVRLQRLGLAEGGLHGNGPLIFLVVEDHGVFHMILEQHLGLDVEEVQGVADVLLQKGRQLVHAFE